MIKRFDLMQWLQSQGVEVLREGAAHTVLVYRLKQRTSTIPRHREINDFLAKKICKDLDLRSPFDTKH